MQDQKLSEVQIENKINEFIELQDDGTLSDNSKMDSGKEEEIEEMEHARIEKKRK